MPCALETRPSSSISGPCAAVIAKTAEALVDDVEVRAAAELGRNNGQYRTHELRGTTVFADHLADIALGDLELDQQVVITLDLRDLHAFGIIDQGLRDRRDQFLQNHVSENSKNRWRLRARTGAREKCMKKGINCT